MSFQSLVRASARALGTLSLCVIGSSLAACGAATEDADVEETDSAESAATATVQTEPDGHFYWGDRSMGSIYPMAFEGFASAIRLELPGSAATTRVRSTFRLPTTGGVPMAVEAFVETRPRELVEGPGLEWFDRHALPFTCSGLVCTIDQTVALLPAVKGADVFVTLYMSPAGGDETTRPGQVMRARIDNGGGSSEWWLMPSTDKLASGRRVHSVVKQKALPPGLGKLAFDAAALYDDAPGSRDDVCAYLVKNPRGAAGFEQADFAWRSARPGNRAACAKPANLVADLTMRDWVRDEGAPSSHQLQINAGSIALPAGASSEGVWALIVVRAGGRGRARLGNFDLHRVDEPWACGQSSHKGTQLWTCSNGTTHKCEDGSPVEQQCAVGCFPQPTGTDDLCIERDASWACSRSSWKGSQYWTCVDGALHRCVDGYGPSLVRCASGCEVRAAGTDDRCK